MQLKGTDTIKAPRSEVWAFLIDADKVAKCTPGLESMKILEPKRKFEALGAFGLGTIKLKFKTEIEWVELVEPEQAKMTMKGTAPGSSIDVASEVNLIEASESTTELQWKANVNVVGTIASLASRLMSPVTAKMTKQFFSCMKKSIES